MNLKTIKNLAGVAILASLTACSGTGNCPPDSNGGTLSLKLTAPDQYPAGRPTPITAYLTMTNTSDVNANNLYYDIPNSSNYTGVSITVANDSSNPCRAIAAHQSCTFPAVIGANAKPGSFTVTATPNGSASNNSVLTKVKSLLGGGNSLSLTANIGLTDVPAIAEAGNNNITFLYSKTIAASTTGDNLISIVAYVHSSEGNYNTINLTDVNGNLLNFSTLSGNSGNGLTNLTTGSIVTFLLTIPAGASGSYNFYAQTMENGAVVKQGTKANPINLTNATYGVLVVQPTEFKLSAMESYTSQTITYTNIGNGEVSDLSIVQPTAPLSLSSNNCGSSLAAGASCTVVLNSQAAAGTAGSGSLVTNYNNGGGSQTTTSQYNYAGVNAESGLSIVATNNFNFSTNTVNYSESTQVLLTNTGNVSESNFVFSFNPSTYFSVAVGTSGTPCALSGNTVTNALAAGQSCSVTLIYTNATISSAITQMNVDYRYDGKTANPETKTIHYDTTQATANLLVNPNSHNFGTIIANSSESKTESFTITNSGPDNITSLLTSSISGINASYFTLLSSTGANDCQTKSTINVGESCTLTVRFGATATVESNVTASLSITGTSATGGTINSATALTGIARAPLSANVQIYQITHSASVVGGNGESQNTAFQIESTDAAGGSSITLYYKNIGDFPATDFTINTTTPPSGYTVDSDSTCGDNNSTTLESNGANSCYVVLKPNTSTPGSLNISLLGNLPASWTDERGLQSAQTILWNNGSSTLSMIYVNVFAPASVTAVMSSSTTGSPSIESVTIESTFYVVFTLSGGYNVQNTTYTVNTTGGFTPTSGSCAISSTNSTCSVAFTAPSSATTGNISITGDPTPTPNTFNFSVGPIPGTLRLALESSTVGTSRTNQATISLVNSSYVSGLTVNVSSTDTSKATISPASCTISSTNSCQVTITGVAVGSTTIQASAIGYAESSATLNVVQSNLVIFISESGFNGGTLNTKTSSFCADMSANPLGAGNGTWRIGVQNSPGGGPNIFDTSKKYDLYTTSKATPVITDWTPGGNTGAIWTTGTGNTTIINALVAAGYSVWSGNAPSGVQQQMLCKIYSEPYNIDWSNSTASTCENCQTQGTMLDGSNGTSAVWQNSTCTDLNRVMCVLQ